MINTIETDISLRPLSIDRVELFYEAGKCVKYAQTAALPWPCAANRLAHQ